MPKSTTSCNNLLNLWYRAVAWANIADNAAGSPLANITIRLATASYGVASTGDANETSYTNYVAQVVARSTSGWTAAAGGSISNAADINYPQCGATGATITSACAAKATGIADIFHYGDLNSPIAISNQIQPRFPAGALTITEA